MNRCAKRFILIVIVVLIIAPANVFSAVVPYTSGGVDMVLDESTNLYWMADLSRYADITFPQVEEQIAADNAAMYGNTDSWQLAGFDEVISLFGETPDKAKVELFDPYLDADNSLYRYEGRTATFAYTDAHYYEFYRIPTYSDSISAYGTGAFWDDSTDPYLGAWVYTTETPVPIPGAVWLLGSGLIGIVGVRRKFKK